MIQIVERRTFTQSTWPYRGSPSVVLPTETQPSGPRTGCWWTPPCYPIRGKSDRSGRAPQRPASTVRQAQYRYLCGLIAKALQLEGALAKNYILGRRDAPTDPLFNPALSAGPSRENTATEGRSVADLIAAYRSEREVLHGKERHGSEVPPPVPGDGGSLGARHAGARARSSELPPVANVSEEPAP